VLQRHVDVFADLWVGCNFIDEVVVKVGGVGIEDADPAKTGEGRKFPKQVGEAFAVSPVLAVPAETMAG
jgi:hypothetical protein